jgi:ATP-binding cassette, subfamily F, member 3
MLRLIDVAIARGARTLYRNVSAIAPPGERIGLVGANGSGKSSLFSAILGDLGIDAGDLEAPPLERIAHVAQDIEAADVSALEYVLEGHAPLTAARAELAQAERQHDDLQLAHALATLAELNEGAITAEARGVLHGLGFAESDGVRPVASFSGGWRNRLALARALLRPADLLLLDEPTNHLDLDSVIWLEAWLKRQPATVLVISHDREFLDRIGTDDLARQRRRDPPLSPATTPRSRPRISSNCASRTPLPASTSGPPRICRSSSTASARRPPRRARRRAG